MRRLADHFCRLSIARIPLVENAQADALDKLASTHGSKGLPPKAEVLSTPTVSTIGIATIEATLSWMEEIPCYKKEGTLPINRAAARRLRCIETCYCKTNGKLYHRAFSQPLLRCLAPLEAETILVEVHEGICGEHIGG